MSSAFGSNAWKGRLTILETGAEFHLQTLYLHLLRRLPLVLKVSAHGDEEGQFWLQEWFTNVEGRADLLLPQGEKLKPNQEFLALRYERFRAVG